jgi:hypothetical protein
VLLIAVVITTKSCDSHETPLILIPTHTLSESLRYSLSYRPGCMRDVKIWETSWVLTFHIRKCKSAYVHVEFPNLE